MNTRIFQHCISPTLQFSKATILQLFNSSKLIFFKTIVQLLNVAILQQRNFSKLQLFSTTIPPHYNSLTLYFIKSTILQHCNSSILPKFPCNNKHVIKIRYDAISFCFFIFIYHIIYNYNPELVSSAIWHHQPINIKTNK